VQSGVRKGKPPCVLVTTARRAGNKQVVLVSNLEALGVDAGAFARDVQLRMAASASVNRQPPPGTSQGAQVQVQGGDTRPVVQLLCGKYGVPSKLVRVL